MKGQTQKAVGKSERLKRRLQPVPEQGSRTGYADGNEAGQEREVEKNKEMSFERQIQKVYSTEHEEVQSTELYK